MFTALGNNFGGSIEFYPELGQGLIYLDGSGNWNYSEYGVPLYVTSVGLSLANGGTLNNLNIRYMNTGVQSYGNYAATNLQFFRCGAAFDTEYAGLYAANVLMSGVGVGFGGRSFSATAENLTFGCGLNYGEDYGDSINNENYSGLTLNNSLLTDVYIDTWGYNRGVSLGGNNTVTLPGGSGVYKADNYIYYMGNYYCYYPFDYHLASGSPYRNAGTTGIGPGWLAQLQNMTTWAVSDGGWPDNDGMPDLGYHYPVDPNALFNGVPAWWLWQYFGSYAYNGTNQDDEGETLLYYYTNSIPPTNAIAYYKPPVLTITSPVLVNGVATVVKPYLQVKGFANKDLASLSYNISNATGVFTNQDVSVVDVAINTNTMVYSTNTFQAYDVPLAPGDNIITLRVTDAAGNIVTTNFDAVLDYSQATTPPTAGFTWPTDNMKVSGSSTTIRGTMSDETGTIAAQVDNGDGTFTTIPGLVERDNTFWIDNVPLNGTTQTVVQIQATSAAGLSTTTSLTINPGDVQLTINTPTTGDDLWMPACTVAGTVSDRNVTVVVYGLTVILNGVPVSENGRISLLQPGLWEWLEFSDVPIYGEGTATFDVVAYSGGTMVANVSKSIEKSSYVAVVEHSSTKNHSSRDSYGGSTTYSSLKEYSVQTNIVAGGPWHFGYTGNLDVTKSWSDEGGPQTYESLYTWSDTDPGTEQYAMDGVWDDPEPFHYYNDHNGTDYYDEVTAVTDVDLIDVNTWAVMQHYYTDKTTNYKWTDGGTVTTASVQAKTVMKLFTGGKSVVGRKSLICISASAREYTAPPYYSAGAGWDTYLPDVWAYTPSTPVDNSNLQVGGRQVGADGNVWVALPDNSEQIIAVNADGVHHYKATVSAQKYQPYITANDVGLSPDIINVTKCVGEEMVFKLKFTPTLPENPETGPFLWVFQGTYVNDHAQPYPNGSDNWFKNADLLNAPSVTNWWVAGQDPAQFLSTMNVRAGEGLTFSNGQYVAITAKGLFNMLRPQVSWTGTNVGPIACDTNWDQKYGYYCLHFGSIQISYQPGMTFTPIALVPWTYGGSLSTIQLISVSDEDCGTNGLTAHVTGSGLDNAVDGLPRNLIYNQYFDEPGGTCEDGNNHEAISDSFQTYLMFNPETSSSIVIPLKLIAWNWSGEADSAGVWHLTSSNHHISINDQDAMSFPTWTNTIINGSSNGKTITTNNICQ